MGLPIPEPPCLSGNAASQRWLALYILCLGDLMIVLDTTIVNVALPSIRTDLHFTETSLVWVVNAYLLTFGGFLLLGGRLADLFGNRRIFLSGLAVFTLASLACGLATTQGVLVVARAVQGLGGAVVSAVALALIMNAFTEPGERARAMGVFGFVSSGGGSIGVLLGGLLTSSLSWHWIFLVNIPIGIAVYVLCRALLPDDRGMQDAPRLDVAGAITVTASLMFAVYAVIYGNEAGWSSPATLWKLGAAVALLAAFLVIESRVRAPLMPLSLFRLRSVSAANIVAVLWAAGMFAWFFISALYLQLVLGLGPDAGGAGLPARQHHHGHLFAGHLGEAGHALRHARPAGGGAAAGGGWPAAVRARADHGQCVAGCRSRHDPAGHRRRHRVQSACCWRP